MASDQRNNLVSLFSKQAARLKDRPFLWSKHDGVYRPITWDQVSERVAALAGGLAAIGVERGDRVVLVSENRPEWLIADLAIMAAGGICVPAYTTNTEGDHLHILEDSAAKGVIVSSQRLANRLMPAVVRSANACFVIGMSAPTLKQSGSNLDLYLWDEVLERGRPGNAILTEAADRLSRRDTACLIYTSGTGGSPKGVMLHHGALLHNCEGAYDALENLGLKDEVYLSHLPLSHSYEHTVGQYFPMAIGAQIYYAEGIEALAANMKEARPTIMTAVPRLYDTLHQRITRQARKAGGIKLRMFIRALDLGRQRFHNPASLGTRDRIVDRMLDKLVRDKIRGLFGGRLKALVSGGAALNPEVGLFFEALGVRVLQGYGQTEAAPVVSVNRPGKSKMHTVGPPLKDVEVRIADDGEIVVRGELVMQGYWRSEEATRQVIRDGWLHTGDIGEIDRDGHLRITDRKKDIIAISGGDNVSPARIEGILTLEPEVAQAMVYGDRRPHLVALLVPDQEWLLSWARTAAKPADLKLLATDAEFGTAMAAAVDRVNAKLSVFERIRRFVIASEPFSIDNDQLTPTLKVRRHVVRDVYGRALDALYG